MFFTQEILNKLLIIIKGAGDIIITNYVDTAEVEIKPDNSPLTKTDILTNQFIVKNLQKLTPKIPILSEESEKAPYSQRKNWSEYWIVDPLDGTQGFIDKTGDFCVCIGYIKHNKPIFGMIYLPITSIYYYAHQNKAYKLTKNSLKRIYVSDPATPLRVIIGRYSSRSETIKHLQKITNDGKYKISVMGSAIKVCLIAEGKFDYYPGLGVCSEWDIAAASYILTAAGGHITDLNGKALKYNTKNDFISTKFIASGA